DVPARPNRHGRRLHRSRSLLRPGRLDCVHLRLDEGGGMEDHQLDDRLDSSFCHRHRGWLTEPGAVPRRPANGAKRNHRGSPTMIVISKRIFPLLIALTLPSVVQESAHSQSPANAPPNVGYQPSPAWMDRSQGGDKQVNELTTELTSPNARTRGQAAATLA